MLRYRNLSEIMSTLIDRTLINTHELNDFSPGSVINSIYTAISLELDQYATLQRRNIKQGIEQGVYEAFGFSRIEARKAYGEIVLEFHTAPREQVTIPRGTTFFSNIQGQNQVYETLEDYSVPQGSVRAVINVYCTTPGTIGNIEKNFINTNSNTLQNLRSVYNPYSFLTGQDREPLENVKQRFREFVETRGRATRRAISYGVRQVEDISGVYIDNQVGIITVYAHDLNGNLPDGLKRLVERAVEDYRPAGIYTVVKPIEKIEIDIDVDVVLRDKTAKTELFRQEITDRISNYLNSMEVSDDIILADVIQLIMNIDDYLIYDVKIKNKIDNRLIANNQLVRAGQIDVNLV